MPVFVQAPKNILTFLGEPWQAARDVQPDMQEARAGRPGPGRGGLHVVAAGGEGHLQRAEGQERSRLQDLPQDRRERGRGRAAGQDAPQQHRQRRQLHRQVNRLAPAFRALFLPLFEGCNQN